MNNTTPSAYDQPAPRYTSYPTAPHFNNTVDETVYRQWLTELDTDHNLSLYFHIPFCQEMCWFCGCHTKIVKRYDPIHRYIDSLRAELNLTVRSLPSQFSVQHIHWGGGSPNLLSCSDYMHMMDSINKKFHIAGDAEIAVELDPRTAMDSYIKALAASGVNRVSIGVQDFNPRVQAAINRYQTFEATERVVNRLRDQDIKEVSIDLLYGLPFQTIDTILETVEQTLCLRPSRISLFGYAHVPWIKKHQRLIDETALPDSKMRLKMFKAATERLTAQGYRWIGLDHFALPDDSLSRSSQDGRMRRNFQGYTTDKSPVLLGFGASAISSLPQGYAQNAAPLSTYQKSIANGQLPIVRGIILNNEDKIRGNIVERLMCDLAVDLEAVCRQYDTIPAKFNSDLDNLIPYIEDGLVSLNKNCITITEHGRPFVRLVAAVFDTYLQTGLNSGTQRHSGAI